MKNNTLKIYMKMMKNKIAIVTGAAMGIDRATALEFAKHD